MVDVSVIVPTFNRWPMIAEAVTSVIEQPDVDFELIVVDDGSTDETAAQLHCVTDNLPAAEERVRILRTDNHGPAAARNRGAESAGAALIAFLDSDDLWMPGKLHRQLDYMRARPGMPGFTDRGNLDPPGGSGKSGPAPSQAGRKFFY